MMTVDQSIERLSFIFTQKCEKKHLLSLSFLIVNEESVGFLNMLLSQWAFFSIYLILYDSSWKYASLIISAPFIWHPTTAAAKWWKVGSSKIPDTVHEDISFFLSLLQTTAECRQEMRERKMHQRFPGSLKPRRRQVSVSIRTLSLTDTGCFWPFRLSILINVQSSWKYTHKQKWIICYVAPAATAAFHHWYYCCVGLLSNW